MEFSRYLECLASDFERLRSVARSDLAAAVPTCPEWTVADLTRHVGQVYLHKTESMRHGEEPEPWPPRELEEEEPLALLERAYAELTHEFATRRPEDAGGGWYTPDQTVGFWMRRMAQETVIHRIDAELAVRAPVASVPPDLAVDGIDELLKVFVAYSVENWSSAFKDVLTDSTHWTYTVQTDGAAWTVRTAPASFKVEDGADVRPDVKLSGAPTAVLRWVWNRESQASEVTLEGPPAAVHNLKQCIAIATQ